MIKEENIAAATLAQIFGSELLKVQQGARTDSGSVPQVVKLNPKSFLQNSNVSSSNQMNKQQEAKMLELLQREAETAFPVNAAASPAASSSPTPSANTAHSTINAPQRSISTTTNLDVNVLEKINSNLERIANRLESISFTATKKTKRKTKPSSL